MTYKMKYKNTLKQEKETTIIISKQDFPLKISERSSGLKKLLNLEKDSRREGK